MSSDVPLVSGTVPTPVAGPEIAPLSPGLVDVDVLEPDADDDPDVPDEPLELPVDVPVEPCRAPCRAADRALLVRSRAVWLAMEARPCDRLVIASLITPINAALDASDWLRSDARAQ